MVPGRPLPQVAKTDPNVLPKSHGGDPAAPRQLVSIARRDVQEFSHLGNGEEMILALLRGLGDAEPLEAESRPHRKGGQEPGQLEEKTGQFVLWNLCHPLWMLEQVGQGGTHGLPLRIRRQVPSVRTMRRGVFRPRPARRLTTTTPHLSGLS